MASREVPEFEKDYPEPYRFGKMPAYGFFIRHIKDVRMHDVAISFMSPEHRPAFILEDVEGADLRQVRAQKAADAPIFVLKNIKDLTIFHTSGVRDTHLDQVEKTSL
jgi:hypothetical protein